MQDDDEDIDYTAMDCGEYRNDHICPCCGIVVDDKGGNYDNEGIYQSCSNCGWESDIDYS